MIPIKRYGRLSLKEVKFRRLFGSFLICKDERNQLVIIGSQTQSLLNHNQPYLYVTKEDKIHISKAIMKARSRGRMMPTDSDMVDSRQYNYRVVDILSVDENKVFEIYLMGY